MTERPTDDRRRGLAVDGGPRGGRLGRRRCFASSSSYSSTVVSAAAAWCCLLLWTLVPSGGDAKAQRKESKAVPVLGDVSPSLLMRREGDSVDIFCEAEGAPSPTVVWLKDGEELVPNDRTRVTRTRIQLREIGKEDAGVYVCVFKNIAGSVSHHVKLVIEGNGWISFGGSAYITHPPQNATVAEGRRVRLQCKAEGYPENITYHWYHKGVDVQLVSSLSHRSRVHDDGTLVIDNVAKDDRGWYKCRPSNDVGNPPEAQAYLNITYLPRVVNMPADLYLPRGLLGRIDCPADANPGVTMVVWSKGKRQIDLTQTKHGRVDRHGALVLRPVVPGDEGAYSCTPYSPLGKGQSSSPVQVYVRDPPYFTLRPKSFYQRQQTQSVTMTCSADGDPKPVITWRKADGSLPDKAKLLHVDGNLTIVNLGRSDDGVYECSASNPVSGIITTTQVIVELTTPHPPYNVTVVATHNAARVTWSPAFDSGFPLHYVVWYRTRDVGTMTWTTLRVAENDVNSVIIPQLIPSADYEVMVLSRNRIGDALFSESVPFRTKNRLIDHRRRHTTPHPDARKFNGHEALRPASPRNITVRQHKQGLLIRWSGAPRSTRPPVDYYVVEYKTVGPWVPLSDRIGDGATSFNWTTASRGATYHFRVFGYGRRRKSEYEYGDEGTGEEQEEEPIESLPSDVITIHTGDPMNEGVRVSDEAIGGAIGGLFLFGVALIAVVFAAKHVKSWRERRKLLKECHVTGGLSSLNSEPTNAESRLSAPSTDKTKGTTVKETPI